MSDHSGEEQIEEVDAPTGYQSLPKDVVADIGTVKLQVSILERKRTLRLTALPGSVDGHTRTFGTLLHTLLCRNRSANA